MHQPYGEFIGGDMSGISLARTAVHVGKRILELRYKLKWSVCHARPFSSAFCALYVGTRH